MKRPRQLLSLGLAAALIAAANCGKSEGDDPAVTALGVLLDPTRNEVCLFTKCRYIFATNATHAGNLGGPSGADSRCQNDTARPNGSGNFKAFLVAAELRRAQPSPPKDWVLTGETWYIRPNLDSGRNVISTTAIGYVAGDGFLITPLRNFLTDSSRKVWTGFSDSLYVTDDTNDCLDWSSNVPGVRGRAGNAARVSYNVASETLEDCSSAHHLICVEQ